MSESSPRKRRSKRGVGGKTGHVSIRTVALSSLLPA